MQQTPGSIKRTLKNLRAIIEESEDPLMIRMAYFAETSLRWATENTVGWKRPEEELKDEVEFLSKELAAAQHCVEPNADHAPKTGTTRNTLVGSR